MTGATLQHLRDRISNRHCDKFTAKNYPNLPSHLKRASVLMPLVWRDSCWQILLTLRSHNVSINKGQVALPGGKQDQEDLDEIDTALREAEEEVGITRHHVQEVLGILHPLVSMTNFLIHPVVAVLSPHHIPVPNTSEVSDVFYVPLERFLSSKEMTIKNYRHGPCDFNMLYFMDKYAGKTYTTWGLTAILCCSLAVVVFDRETEFELCNPVGPLNPDNAFTGNRVQVDYALQREKENSKL